MSDIQGILTVRCNRWKGSQLFSPSWGDYEWSKPYFYATCDRDYNHVAGEMRDEFGHLIPGIDKDQDEDGNYLDSRVYEALWFHPDLYPDASAVPECNCGVYSTTLWNTLRGYHYDSNPIFLVENLPEYVLGREGARSSGVLVVAIVMPPHHTPGHAVTADEINSLAAALHWDEVRLPVLSWQDAQEVMKEQARRMGVFEHMKFDKGGL